MTNIILFVINVLFFVAAMLAGGVIGYALSGQSEWGGWAGLVTVIGLQVFREAVEGQS